MSDRERYERGLRELFADPDYRPIRSRDMAARLGLPRTEFYRFRAVLEEFRRDGLIVRGSDSLWRLPGQPEKTLLGRLDIALAGHAFLIPDDSGEADVFIAPDRLRNAFDGDLVRIRVIDERRRGGDRGRSGEVVEVVERARIRLVGTMRGGGRALVDDPRSQYEFSLVFSPAAPAKSASQAAKSQRRRLNAGKAGGEADRSDTVPEGAKLPPEGQKILMEVIDWPGEGNEARAAIVEVLGPSGDPDTETAAILAENGAPGPFPGEVLLAARRLERGLPPEDRIGRLDLTGEICFTIDPPDARDFDDALGIRVNSDGGLTVDVHIADVAHYVKPGSELDGEARGRSTSIYLPGRVIPMLPEEISNDICSLRPGEERPAKTVRLQYTLDGELLGFSIHRSLIRSRRRFAYGEIGEILASPRLIANFPDRDLAESVFRLHGLSRRLRERRLSGGAIELNLVEYRIVIDSEGRAEALEKTVNDESHQLVEEFMLAANRAVAEWAAANGLPVLHRSHPQPGEERVEELARYLTASGYPFKPPFQREKFMAVVARAAGRPEEHAINLMILKTFPPAAYDSDPGKGHFALNFPRYLHFTSPIRRYPDLHLHQMLDLAFALGREKSHKLPKKLRRLPAAPDDLAGLAAHCSSRERRAMRIEEEVKDFRRLELLSRAGERDFEAVVTGVRKYGVFVELAGFFVEGLLAKTDLSGKGYSAREELPPPAAGRGDGGGRPRLSGPPGFHIGQTVLVRLRRVNLSARRCDLEFLEAL
ncbi:MAG: RNB domain-containing ribonuclease [Planctomycetota bacterium]|jgi:ribonuclease R|nr:RNB domain-containing ribonuclease [Planctomycetota bacterium]